MLRYITKQIDTSLCYIWKRFIDDIICFIATRDQETLQLFIDTVRDKFKEFGLDITVRLLNPENPDFFGGEKVTSIEYLDINHSFDENDLVQTSLFIKDTAKNSTYLHPSSYHPKYIPSGILKGELIRVRKISSNDSVFRIGAESIFAKARRSEFPETIINSAIDMIKDWDTEKRIQLLAGTVKEKAEDDATVWVSQLPTCIKEQFSDLKRHLPNKKAPRYAYQKPPSLSAILFKPRALENVQCGCKPCGKCKMCGNHGRIKGQNMVKTVTTLKLNKISLPIKANLNCKSSGIYVAICTICKETYVGQTSTTFSTRFNNHRKKWIDAPVSDRDDTALLDHYREQHSNKITEWNNLDQKGFDLAFKLVFVDKVGPNLAKQEDYWKVRLQSSINRCTIITPTITT